MARRTSAAVERSAVDALIGALESLGADAEVTAVEQPECDLVVEVAGSRFEVEVKSVVTSAFGQRLARRRKRDGPPLLVVADRIASDAKQSFRKSGINYFDRRGELRIVHPPLVIDTIVASAQPIAAGAGGSLDSQVAKEVAIACLLAPDQPHGVREIARYIDRAPSAVSNAMAGLRADGLLTSEGEAMVPDLFHELLAVWRRRAVSLAALPHPRSRGAERLGLGLHEPEDTMGWAITDTRRAAPPSSPRSPGAWRGRSARRTPEARRRSPPRLAVARRRGGRSRSR